MTEQEKQELSKAVADKYGIGANNYSPHGMDIADATWLHEDSARCFDLMVEHKIEVINTKNFAIAYYYSIWVQVPINGYSTEFEASRIAILKALLAKD